jgi:hypothetical protein
MLAPLAAISVAWAAVCLASCASSTRSKPQAQRVCDAARRAAAGALGAAVNARLARQDPADLSCVLRKAGVSAVLVVRQSPDAYSEFNTTSAHQSQVFGPGVHQAGEIPQPMTVRGATVAVWIPAEHEVVATDAQPGQGGVFLTASVSGRGVHHGSAMNLARAVAEATFAAHPDASS